MEALVCQQPSWELHLARQRQVIRAFYAAAWTGDFDALVQVLDPDVVLRTDFGTTRPPTVVRGAQAVAKQARAPRGGQLRPALVNGTIGTLITRDGRPFSVMASPSRPARSSGSTLFATPTASSASPPPSSTGRSEQDGECRRQRPYACARREYMTLSMIQEIGGRRLGQLRLGARLRSTTFGAERDGKPNFGDMEA
jgi:hypothetical protein